MPPAPSSCACGRAKWGDSSCCIVCYREAAEARKQEMVERWNAGHSNFTIALALGINPRQVASRMAQLRLAGYPVNYRRPDRIEHGRTLARRRRK